MKVKERSVTLLFVFTKLKVGIPSTRDSSEIHFRQNYLRPKFCARSPTRSSPWPHRPRWNCRRRYGRVWEDQRRKTHQTTLISHGTCSRRLQFHTAKYFAVHIFLFSSSRIYYSHITRPRSCSIGGIPCNYQL